MLKLKKYLIVVLIGLILVNPILALSAQAQAQPAAKGNTGTSSIDVPVYQGVQSSIETFLCTPSEGDADSHALENCVNKLYRFGIAFGAIALVFFLVFAGYMYMTGGETGKSKAKGIVQNAIIGIALLLGSYLILSFINPSLVIFRPIQPPIFQADNLPSCEEIGFGQKCVLEDGSVGTSTSTGSGGTTYAKCSQGLVQTQSLGLKTSGGSNTKDICKDLGEKLLAVQKDYTAKTNNKYYFLVGQTVNPGKGPSVSSCHYYNSETTGNCADLSPRTVSGDAKPSNSETEPWLQLCKSMEAQGISVLVELIDMNGCGHKPSKATNATGSHFHVSLKK